MSAVDPFEGPPIRFTDFRKLMYLARNTGDGSDFQCNTRGGEITEWNDARPQPTYEEIEAVTEEQVAQLEIDEQTRQEEARLEADPILKAIIDNVPGLRGKVIAQLRQPRT